MESDENNEFDIEVDFDELDEEGENDESKGIC
jgi:hypothetical protein